MLIEEGSSWIFVPAAALILRDYTRQRLPYMAQDYLKKEAQMAA